MKIHHSVVMILGLLGLSGCEVLRQVLCAPACRSTTQNTSSLVGYLYPDGQAPPAANTVPELHVPLRVGLAFLPSRTGTDSSALTAAQKQDLLERIRQRFASRRFVREIVVIPEYYLANAQGFAGLQGIQRLYNIDLMALVSYDQVTHADDNTLSLGYLTIIGAYFLPGTSRDTTTLVDLAVVDPATRSLVVRAGGTSASHGISTAVNIDRESRQDSATGFNDATSQMIGNFDQALTAFQADVRDGRANVRVVDRAGAPVGSGGGGGLALPELLVLAGLLAANLSRRHAFSASSDRQIRGQRKHDGGPISCANLQPCASA